MTTFPYKAGRTILVYKARCVNICNQRVEEVSAAFDETVLKGTERNIREVLDKLFRSHGYNLLEICEKSTVSVIPSTCGRRDTQKRKSAWCPLHMPGAPPLLCTLRDCGEYERGCYAIRNA